MLKWLRNKSSKHLLPKGYKSNIDPDAFQIVTALQKAGFESYLVGGCVRDLCIGKKPKDFDIATSASPQKVKNLIRRSFIIGKRFRIVLAKRQLENDTHDSDTLFPPVLKGGKVTEKEIEITTFRREPEMQGDKLNENVFGSSKDDAFRRDFTVNGLFLDPNTGKIVDHVGGVEDLQHKKLRIIGNPAERFREDPIRILRAIRFCVRSGFTLEKKTEAALVKEINCLAEAKPERVREEILKFLKEGTAEEAFRWLWKLNAWHHISATWTQFLKSHDEQREYFFKACGQMKANDWHQSFGAAPLFYIFLLPLTTLPREKSALINDTLKATADELKISKIEREEIQFLHKSLRSFLQSPNHSFPLEQKPNFIMRQIQFTLTLSFLKDIDPRKWSSFWDSHKLEWEEHLAWLVPQLLDLKSSGPKRPPRRGSSKGRKRSFQSRGPNGNSSQNSNESTGANSSSPHKSSARPRHKRPAKSPAGAKGAPSQTQRPSKPSIPSSHHKSKK